MTGLKCRGVCICVCVSMFFFKYNLVTLGMMFVESKHFSKKKKQGTYSYGKKRTYPLQSCHRSGLNATKTSLVRSGSVNRKWMILITAAELISPRLCSKMERIPSHSARIVCNRFESAQPVVTSKAATI